MKIDDSESLKIESGVIESPIGDKLLARSIESDSFDVILLETPDSWSRATAKGISIGSTRSQLFEQYGEPIRAIPSPGGSTLYYPLAGLLFSLNSEEVVVGWKYVHVRRR